MPPLDAASPNAPNPALLLAQYGIDSQDLEQVRQFGETILPKLDEYIARFYDWLERQPEFERFFTSSELVGSARRSRGTFTIIGRRMPSSYIVCFPENPWAPRLMPWSPTNATSVFRARPFSSSASSTRPIS